MKSFKEIAQELLLKGEHINKGQFHATYGTFTLTQRIEEIRKEGWDVRSKTIPGKRGMVEYWLEPQEIDRIKNKPYKPILEQKPSDEQLVEEKQNIAEMPSKTAENEKYEQLGLGLLGCHNL